MFQKTPTRPYTASNAIYIFTHFVWAGSKLPFSTPSEPGFKGTRVISFLLVPVLRPLQKMELWNEKKLRSVNSGSADSLVFPKPLDQLQCTTTTKTTRRVNTHRWIPVAWFRSVEKMAQYLSNEGAQRVTLSASATLVAVPTTKSRGLAIPSSMRKLKNTVVPQVLFVQRSNSYTNATPGGGWMFQHPNTRDEIKVAGWQKILPFFFDSSKGEKWCNAFVDQAANTATSKLAEETGVDTSLPNPSKHLLSLTVTKRSDDPWAFHIGVNFLQAFASQDCKVADLWQSMSAQTQHRRVESMGNAVVPLYFEFHDGSNRKIQSSEACRLLLKDRALCAAVCPDGGLTKANLDVHVACLLLALGYMTRDELGELWTLARRPLKHRNILSCALQPIKEASDEYFVSHEACAQHIREHSDILILSALRLAQEGGTDEGKVAVPSDTHGVLPQLQTLNLGP